MGANLKNLINAHRPLLAVLPVRWADNQRRVGQFLERTKRMAG